MNSETTTTTGSLVQVRAALAGITGIAPATIGSADEFWNLVMARGNHEMDTVDSLRRRNYAAYWPSFETRVVGPRAENGCLTRKMKRVGILPGYVFCKVDPTRDLTLTLDQIVSAFDIVRTHSGNPLLLRDDDIGIIRRIEIGLNTPLPPGGKAVHNFKRGQKVRFVDDLIGRWPPGRIETLARDGRICVEIDLMGRKVPIWVLPHQIERT